MKRVSGGGSLRKLLWPQILALLIGSLAFTAAITVPGPVVAQDAKNAQAAGAPAAEKTSAPAAGETKKRAAKKGDGEGRPSASLEWPPKLPGGVDVVTDTSPDFLAKPETANLLEGVVIAKTPPTIDWTFYPGQYKASKLWSDWGDGSTAGTKYYSAIGDHSAPRGVAQVYEYDSAAKKIRLLMDVKEFLEAGNMPADMDYTPGKIHARTDIGSDGWVYFSTHRGATKGNTDDAHGYKGDWIFRVNPQTGKQEIAAAYPMPKHTIPASVLDSQRLIYYGGTAAGNDADVKGVQFLAYDVKNGKLLKTAPGGPVRYMMLSSSTGCVYWRGRGQDITGERPAGATRGAKGKRGAKGAKDAAPAAAKGGAAPAAEGGGDEGGESAEGPGSKGFKYDPKTNEITECKAVPDVRACTRETPDGLIYGVSGHSADIWAFNVKTETLAPVGPGGVGREGYTTTIDVDPAGRYVYYIPGAHSQKNAEGTPIVQFDTKTKTRKIIAFVAAYYSQKYGYSPDSTFGSALSPDGSILFVTWNGKRTPGGRSWDTCSMMAIHIPESERQP